MRFVKTWSDETNFVYQIDCTPTFFISFYLVQLIQIRILKFYNGIFVYLLFVLLSVFNLFSIVSYIGILWCILISIETFTL